MEYQINGKKYRIFPRNLDEIGHGKEGVAYKFNGSVLKLYHTFPRKNVLSSKACQYMTSLSTQRVLLPSRIVLDKKRNMKGYIIGPYIENHENIYMITGEKFIEERNAIIAELIYLGEHYILADDFNMPNFKCDDKFYIIDPGSFVVHWDMMKENKEENKIALANMSIENFNIFVCNEIILNFVRRYIKDGTYPQVYSKIKDSYFKSDFPCMMDYIMQYIEPDKMVGEGIKQLVKSHKN